MPEDVTSYFGSTNPSHSQAQSDYQFLDNSSYSTSSRYQKRFARRTSSLEKTLQEKDSPSANVFDEEIVSFEDSESRHEHEFANESKWMQFYYKHVVVDKSTIGVSILDSFMYNSDLKPVEENRRVWSWLNFSYFGWLNVLILIHGRLQLLGYN